MRRSNTHISGVIKVLEEEHSGNHQLRPIWIHQQTIAKTLIGHVPASRRATSWMTKALIRELEEDETFKKRPTVEKLVYLNLKHRRLCEPRILYVQHIYLQRRTVRLDFVVVPRRVFLGEVIALLQPKTCVSYLYLGEKMSYSFSSWRILCGMTWKLEKVLLGGTYPCWIEFRFKWTRRNFPHKLQSGNFKEVVTTQEKS